MMSSTRIHGALPCLLALAVILPFLHAGCGDDSRTTGSQLKLSEEAKTQIKDMRDMYKENKGMRKNR
jgi:hypothetical protein